MIKVDSIKCDQCGTCISVCPVAAIIMIDKIIINHEICIGCNNCVKVCSFSALSHSDKLYDNNTKCGLETKVD